ncbi:MAG: 50S ribosomal protein L10 [Candidatus Omnitrophica bacterium]|nr:50S ribosomal protein L10 [Candidatus Omnitrophota bacterium]
MQEKYGILTKKLMYSELKKEFESHSNFVITNYKGTTSIDMDNLRKELAKSDSKYLAVKNSLVKRLFEESDRKELVQFIKGEVGISFTGNLIESVKILVSFEKTHELFKLNCAYIEGKLEGAERVKQLAALPPREVLLSMVLTGMKSPISNFVGVLNNLLTGLICVINAIQKKKGGGN